MIIVAAPWLHLITWTNYGGWAWLLMTPHRLLRSGRLKLTIDDALAFCYCPIEGAEEGDWR